MMKILLISLILSNVGFSKTVFMRKTKTNTENIKKLMDKIASLEKRVAALEANAKKGTQTSIDSNGLKVKDLSNQSLGNDQQRLPSSDGEKLTPSKRQEIMEQLKKFKKQFDERQKALDDLLNDGY